VVVVRALLRGAIMSLALALPGVAQAPATKPATAAAPDTSYKGGPFDKLHFRHIGPTGPSGRIDDFAVLETDPDVFYVAAATGGL